MKFVKTLTMMTCILLLPLNAFAEDEEEELKAIEITATRTSIEEENPASALTIITQEEIQQKQHMQVKDILREQLGVNVVTQGPLGGSPTSVFMRGANSASTLVMIDGVQVNDNNTGGFNFSHLQMDNIERIEILRGPQSTLWGADAVGGVINIITKRGRGKLKHTISLEAGSFETFREALTSSGSINKFDYSISASRTDTDGFSSANEDRGFTEDDGYQNTTVSSRLGYNFLDDGRIEFLGRYINTRSDFDALSFVPPNPVVDGIAETQTSDSYYFSIPITKSAANWWDIKLNNGFSYNELVFPTFNFKSISRTYTTDFQNNFRLGKSLSVILGFEYQAINGFLGPNLSFNNNSQGYYLEGHYNFNETYFLKAGLRENVNSKFDDQLTYKFEGAWLIKELGTKLRVSYATGFRAPTISDLFSPFGSNPNLKPEESENVEVGIQQNLFSENLKLSLTYFYTNYDNLIALDGFFIPQNVGRATSQGIEASAQYQILKNLNATVNYTWNEATDDIANTTLLRRPRGILSFTLHHNWMDKLDSLVTVNYRSSMISNSAGASVGGRATLRAAIGYQLNDHWKLTARGENLLDKDYEEPLGFGTAGISGYAGFVYSF